ncbi:MAG: twin transmembrane helix small protein [Parvibaculum sp.]
METLVNYFAPILMGAVLVILIFGLINMARGGSMSRSQTLMRWRVGLQFIAVVLLMTALYLTSR